MAILLESVYGVDHGRWDAIFLQDFKNYFVLDRVECLDEINEDCKGFKPMMWMNHKGTSEGDSTVHVCILLQVDA